MKKDKERVKELENAKKESKKFWEWFVSNNEMIKNILGGEKQDPKYELIKDINRRLKLIFPKFDSYLHISIEMVRMKFIFAHLDDEYLIAMSEEFKNEMPESLKKEWNLVISQSLF